MAITKEVDNPGGLTELFQGQDDIAYPYLIQHSLRCKVILCGKHNHKNAKHLIIRKTHKAG